MQILIYNKNIILYYKANTYNIVQPMLRESQGEQTDNSVRNYSATSDICNFTLLYVELVVEHLIYVAVCCVSLKCNKYRRTEISVSGKLTLSSTDRNYIVTSIALSHNLVKKSSILILFHVLHSFCIALLK